MTCGLRLTLRRPDGVETPGVANPIRFSSTPIEYAKAAPSLGEGTSRVLSDLLGMGESEIAALRASGAIGEMSVSGEARAGMTI